jgi:hypothetical protein
MFALIAIIMAQLQTIARLASLRRPKKSFSQFLGPFRFSKGVGIPTPKEKKKSAKNREI